jgi:HlyD family secretion protein
MQLVRNKRVQIGVLLGVAIVAYFAISALMGTATSFVTVVRSDLIQTVVASGRIETPARIEIASQTLGHITKIFVDEGARVTVGQKLIELDDREARAAREQAAANLQIAQTRLKKMETVDSSVAEQNVEQARTNVQLAQNAFENAQRLRDAGHLPQAQFDEARLKLELAQSTLQSAKTLAQSQRRTGADFKLLQLAVREAQARLKVAQSQLGNMSIVAPVAGTVVLRMAEVGDVAQPGKVLMVVAKQGLVQAVADVDEKNLAHLRIGQTAWVVADAFADQRIPARLQFIAPAVDAARGTVEIKLNIEKVPDFLRPEMTVTVEIIAKQLNNALVLPIEAIRDANSDDPWVMSIRDQRAVRNDVVLGAKGEGSVEIVSGLKEGDIVIPVTQAKVRVGQKMRPDDRR